MNQDTKRVWNFSAGPAMVPLTVLNKIKDEFLSYQGLGYSIMETSHRTKVFEAVLEDTKARLAKLLGLDESYAIALLHGSATMEFLRIPMNFLNDKNQSAEYIHTGNWANKAIQQAERYGNIHIAGSSKDAGFSYIPKGENLSFNKSKSRYLYLCSNNTIYGTQYHSYPKTGNMALVADFSSDILCRHVDMSQFSLIFACAQKNLGIAGTSFVAIKKEFLEQAVDDLPPMLSYKELFKANSLMNTPPVFCIYFMREVLAWIEARGLDTLEKENRQKAERLYNVIDSHSLYLGVAEKEDRSLMNVTWNFKQDDMLEKFLKGAFEEDLVALKGHRLAGGLRASIYNAMPLAGVEKLAAYMEKFAKENS